jgi:beta-lactamase class A
VILLKKRWIGSNGTLATMPQTLPRQRKMASFSRRALLAGPLLAGWNLPAWAKSEDPDNQQADFAALERRHGGRLGVAILDTAGAKLIAYRGDERFLLCSTYKYLAAAYVLARVDRGEESLSRRLVYTRDDLVTYSPVTEKHAGENGLTMGEICEAALTIGDNTAGNLLLDSFGGPAALTAHLRTLGDGVTRLDRRETALNDTSPGDLRDTTSPVAMLETIRKTALGPALSSASRTQLANWLVAATTGDKRLRTGVPKDWRIGDKTGSGGDNAANDIALIWPPGRAPIIVTAFYAGSQASDDERDAVIADVGRLAIRR